MALLASKIDIAGVGISNLTLKESIEILDGVIDRGDKVRACVTPVNCLVWAQNDEELKHLYNTADLVFCDGVPLLWMSKFLKTPLKARVTGLDLLPQYVEECAAKGYSMFLLGAKDGVAETLKNEFEKKHPGIKIVGVYSPPFAERFSDQENQKMVELINGAKPNVLWVSLTAPKQDFWIYEHLHKLNINVAIGVGGAFEVAAGLIKRAPVWMQKAGLEWLFRFANEPKRLFRRYFIEAPAIFPAVLAQKFKRN
ncbi:WecB/TagA/CpsF family glycosyltransferase [Mucilaginibacter glaciei]|uniref:WecB/TagA/CpsF family glycosyltransferase n=1 Tax=Mucilaginibacter glaciei TaxID=2772109 RepID=A0A926S2L5_9SPHI|nr:WecB/TagA/CpsF family glycosyltransferase [Mucilaginibacter glaciei]MBD1393324.1 WecB/TagA/CpsF family glycosyltransferase [Mucilaginibacter glaciei]